jgi:LPXTG-motif cell wall-anchored protein
MTLRARVLAVAVLVAAAAPALSVATPAGATTGGCRTIGGGAVSSPGPHRATVVVDTGAGAVWSACVSFDGTISGLAALELARSVITDLDPVYDTYSGIGRAVCRLRGVGTDPPDCLGKSVDYWAYFHNGTYARGGGGSTELHDGDVDAWHYGTGGKPRAATVGTEATDAPPPTTAAPTTAPPRPPTTTAGPSTGMTGSPSGAGVGSGSGSGGSGGQRGAGAGGGSTSVPTTVAGSTTTGGGATSTTADASPRSSIAASGGDADPQKVVGGALGSGGTPPAGGSATTDSDGSPLTSILGFAGALALVAGGAVLVRRRRRAATAPSASASPSTPSPA